MLSALNSIFSKPQPQEPITNQLSAMQLALRLSTLGIVSPVGVAAIMGFMMIAPEYPGMDLVVLQALLTIMVLDFLVMFFIDNITKVPGLVSFLQVMGSVLVFIQVALGIQTIVLALKALRVIPSTS
jgi:multiple antibiotic resistance protein